MITPKILPFVEPFLTFDDRVALFKTCKALHRNIRRSPNGYEIELFGDQCLLSFPDVDDEYEDGTTRRPVCTFYDREKRDSPEFEMFRFYKIVMCECHPDVEFRKHACRVFRRDHYFDIEQSTITRLLMAPSLWNANIYYRVDGEPEEPLKLQSDEEMEMFAKILDHAEFEEPTLPTIHIYTSVLTSVQHKYDDRDQWDNSLIRERINQFYNSCVKISKHTWKILIYYEPGEDLRKLGIDQDFPWLFNDSKVKVYTCDSTTDVLGHYFY